MSEETSKQEDTSIPVANDQTERPAGNTSMSNFNGPMPSGNFDNGMGMRMLNPYQRFQQIWFMQQLQRQQLQRQMAAATGNSTATNIPPESQKPPSGYVCYKCGQPGHWIYYCPNVPRGQFVPRAVDKVQQESEEQQKPSELSCMICSKLMTEAMLISCCGKSFCKECTYTFVFIMFIFSLLLFLYVFYSIYDLHFYPCFFFLSEGCKKKEKENTVDVSRILRASFSCVLRERERERQK
ncbi:hypothetical protein RMATCC62417_14923 [Rhizopus microsporus]|nr:hypothetical protein RMATCC62417_14923 [Rhizopus microsporus]